MSEKKENLKFALILLLYLISESLSNDEDAAEDDA